MKKNFSSAISRITKSPKFLIALLAVFALTQVGIIAIRIFVLKNFQDCTCVYCSGAENFQVLSEKQNLKGKKETEIANSITKNEPQTEIQEILYEARRNYLSGEWKGYNATLHEHEISISEDTGYILLDGDRHDLYIDTGDVPKEYRDYSTIGYHEQRSNIAFIPDKGSYMIIDGALTQFVKGTKIDLKGDILEFPEFDTNRVTPYYFELKYDSFGDVLYLIVHVKENGFIEENFYETEGGNGSYFYVSDKILEEQLGMYLYKFPDYNVSEIEFIDKVIDFRIDNYGMRYIDTNHVLWEYFENREVYEISTEFVKTDHTSLWMIPPRSSMTYSDKESAKRIYKDDDNGIFSVEINGKCIGNMKRDLIWYDYTMNCDSFEFMLASSPGVVYKSSVHSDNYKKVIVGTCNYVLDYEFGWLLIN